MAQAPGGRRRGPLWDWVHRRGDGWQCPYCGSIYEPSNAYSSRIRKHLSGLPNQPGGGVEICTQISAEDRNLFRQQFGIIDPAQVAAAEPEDDDIWEDLFNIQDLEGLEDIIGEPQEMDWQQQHAPLEPQLVQGVNQNPYAMDIIHPGGEHPHGLGVQPEQHQQGLGVQPDQHQQGLGVQPDQHQQGLGVQGIELADIIARRDASAAVINAVAGNMNDLISRYHQLLTVNFRINHMLNGGGPPPAPAELEQLDEAVAYIQAHFGLNL